MARGRRQGRWLWKTSLAVVLSVFLGGLGPGLCNAEGPICRGTATGNGVALTFDDDPSPRFTLKILQLLKEYGARATFFVLGEHAARYPRLVKKLVQAGQELENHSYHHVRLSEEDKSVWGREIGRTEVELDLLGSPDHNLFRPPTATTTSPS